MAVCPKCRNNVDDGEKYCDYCDNPMPQFSQQVHRSADFEKHQNHRHSRQVQHTAPRPSASGTSTGYRPSETTSKINSTKVAAIVITIIVLLGILVPIGIQMYEDFEFEQAFNLFSSESQDKPASSQPPDSTSADEQLLPEQQAILEEIYTFANNSAFYDAANYYLDQLELYANSDEEYTKGLIQFREYLNSWNQEQESWSEKLNDLADDLPLFFESNRQGDTVKA